MPDAISVFNVCRTSIIFVHIVSIHIIAEEHYTLMTNYRGKQMNDELFWKNVSSLWAIPVSESDNQKQKEFINGLPKNFGAIDQNLMTDDIPEDDEDW